MKSTNLKTALLMSAMIVFVLACGLPSAGGTEIAPTETATQNSEAPTAPPIQHQLVPISLPTDRSSHAGDYDSSTTADKKSAAGGDRFTFGKIERPFNANTMDKYFGEIDIIDTTVFQDETWIYGKISLKGNESKKLSGKYAIELDVDLDGKGDWLVIVSAPASTEWKTDDVQVYQDVNNDVGSITAMFSDEKGAGDGFETLVFDQGKGTDPDSAWARISSDDPNTVEISVKRSLLGNPEKYLINMWAGNTLLDPALFDINDHFTHTQAGAADPGLEVYYPIKAVSEIDNSCRMAVGFQPTGQEPGLCEVLAPNAPGVLVPGSPQGCQASKSEIRSCNSDPSFAWNSKTCTCDYVGPK